jgi:pilus assembly protein Flp/PilA
MKPIAARFAKDETGATAIEYALIAGVVALGIVISLTGLATGLNGIFSNVVTNLSR